MTQKINKIHFCRTLKNLYALKNQLCAFVFESVQNGKLDGPL